MWLFPFPIIMFRCQVLEIKWGIFVRGDWKTKAGVYAWIEHFGFSDKSRKENKRRKKKGALLHDTIIQMFVSPLRWYFFHELWQQSWVLRVIWSCYKDKKCYILCNPFAFIYAYAFFFILQGYVDFGRFDKFNHFEAGSGQIDFVQVSYFSSWVELIIAITFMQ